MIIKIELPPHLEAYFLAQLSPGQNYSINARSALGAYLMSILENSDRPPTTPKHYIELQVPDRDKVKSYDSRYRFVKVNEQGLQRFHRMIEMLMQKELFAELDVLVNRGEAQRRGGKMTEAIERFIAKYSGDQHLLSIDALRKSYYRYRQRGESLVNKLV